ncbi:YuzD family protein [Peribacillus sp. SCS-155]|uniref:YuzD family protein n=1 Tax=Peribacillus sedimenti TaxID=3115297 RepID=UPI0039068639
MDRKHIELQVYGAEQICASCVNLPSSRETYEWLQAALERKFPDQPFSITYIDIFNPPADPKKLRFSQRVIDEDLFYPVVVIDDEVIGEGSPQLKIIVKEMEKYGYHITA